MTLYRQLRLEIDLVQPTIWMVNDTASVTLDVGAHLTWTFGRDRTPRARRRRRTPANASAPASTSTSTSTSAPSSAAAPTNPAPVLP
jgi:hypothetical protein